MNDTEAIKKILLKMKEQPVTISNLLLWVLKSDGQDKVAINKIEELIK